MKSGFSVSHFSVHLSGLHWLILGLLYLSTVINYADSQALSAPLPTLRTELGLTGPNSPDAIHDLVVYGDSSGAVIAAIAAKREGRSVIWVNPTGFAGGMSASGLGATDCLGRRSTFGGIASEFYDRIAAAYGMDFVRSFEPHVGKQVFEQMIADAGVTAVYNEKLDRTSGKGVTMDGKRIAAITTLSGKTYRGKMFIDATYVGDLMAAAGVTYTVGREPESQYGEDIDSKVSVQDVAYPALHERLLAAKQVVDTSQVPPPKPKAAKRSPTP